MSSSIDWGELKPIESNTQSKIDWGSIKKEPSRIRSIIGAPIKGALKTLKDINPLFPGGPIPQEMETQILEQVFPTQEKPAEQLLERAGKIAPYAATGPGGIVAKGLQTTGGALAGHVAEKLGGGPISQSAAELFGMGVAGIKKGLQPKESLTEAVNFLKKHGFTEKEITPFLQSERKFDFFKKLASKDKKISNLFKNISEKFGGVYDSIIEKGNKQRGLNPDLADDLSYDISQILKKTPPVYRSGIKEDVRELNSSQMKIGDLIQFVQNVNARVGGQRGGKAILGRLKKPTLEYMEKLNPELADEYKLANKLYSQSKGMAKELLPKDFDRFVDAGEIFGLAAGIAKGNIGWLTKIIGLSGARKLSREMLINPKLQNISRRLGSSLVKNDYPTIIRLMTEMSRRLSKKYPELAETIKKQTKQQQKEPQQKQQLQQ